MTIVLMILKIAGCVLLAVLILLILLLAALLFVPFRYRLSVRLDDSSHIRGSFSWFLHLVSVRVSYEGGSAEAVLRILFFHRKLFPAEDAAEDVPERAHNKQKSAEEASTEAQENMEKAAAEEQESAEEASSEAQENMEKAAAETQENVEETQENIEESAVEAHESAEEAVAGTVEEADKKRRPKKRFRIKDALWEKLQSVKSACHQIREACKNIRDVADQLKKIKDHARCRSAFAHLKKELFRLLKIVCPKKLRMDLRFSAGSPDITGEILGVCAMFPITYRKGAFLAPDFEADHAYAKGFADLKGRIFLYQIVGMVLRILSDKDCIYLYRRLSALRK